MVAGEIYAAGDTLANEYQARREKEERMRVLVYKMMKDGEQGECVSDNLKVDE